MVLDSASLTELLAATEPERQSDMAAPYDLTRPARSDNVTSLLSKVTDHTESNIAQHRDQYWDGRHETLGRVQGVRDDAFDALPRALQIRCRCLRQRPQQDRHLRPRTSRTS